MGLLHVANVGPFFRPFCRAAFLLTGGSGPGFSCSPGSIRSVRWTVRLGARLGNTCKLLDIHIDKLIVKVGGCIK